jgi:hypothetical protein
MQLTGNPIALMHSIKKNKILGKELNKKSASLYTENHKASLEEIKEGLHNFNQCSLISGRGRI